MTWLGKTFSQMWEERRADRSNIAQLGARAAAQPDDVTILQAGGVPPALHDVEASGVTEAIVVEWSPSPIQDVRRYEVQYSTSSDFTSPTTVRTRETKFSLVVTAGSTYYFKVRVVNSDGAASEWSLSVSATASAAAALADNSVTTAKILNDNVTFAKMQNIGTQKLIGRDSAGTGDPQEITLNDALDWIRYRWNVRKTTDESRSSTTTLAADSALTVSLDPSNTYHVDGLVLLTTANATMDYKFDLNYSTTVTPAYCRVKYLPAGAAAGTDNVTIVAQNSLIGSTSVAAATSGVAVVEFDVIITPTNFGDLSFRWAQDTSDAGNLTVLKGSFLEWLWVA